MESEAIATFLAEPGRMAQVASVSGAGTPLLGSLWFVFEDGRFWFSSHPTSPLVHAFQQGAEVAVIVDDFTPPDSIRQVRIRGQARLHAADFHRVRRVYERYLGTDVSTWPDFFQSRVADAAWTLWSVAPDSGVATANPGFRPVEVRWTQRADAPL